ncbi:MAG: DUF504 domain-containing protein [Desulfobulbaceae bacterium]|nr:DUF504 domain-containing protein [Desulfobulbaceae bacterium]MDY0351682.1 DUF504 domain-containing protein [Desulfobulbaceae bacterium]
MIPIHQLLSRIRWDREFGRGRFAIGYYDRVRDEIVRVPFEEIIFSPEERNAVRFMDSDGVVHTLPLHRIREVYRDNELIWSRPGQSR